MTKQPVRIRHEGPGDIDAIGQINDMAFGGPAEGQLVTALRENDAVLLSLVALCEDRLVGHILYTPASIESKTMAVDGAALGPMAVHPEFQRRGIGTRLIHTATRFLRQSHCPFVIVLGHPEYYPRFGFEPAGDSGIACEWEVPYEAFMLLILDSAKMKDVSGIARYRPEFSSVPDTAPLTAQARQPQPPK